MKIPSYTRLVPFLCVLLAFGSCSTQKNTPMTRWYHSFTARYNTYFNGHEAYKEGIRTQIDGHTDDFTATLPLFVVSSDKTRGLGKGQFETTITKCEKAIKQHSIKKRPAVSATKRKSEKQKRYLARKEFNPFLKNAWLLMGKAQFHEGKFVEAASTFSYITRHYATQAEVVAEARAWLSRCYAELDWFYDAEDVFNKMKRDSMTHRASVEREASMADYYIRQQRYEEAIPLLRKVVKRERNKKQKARGYYLLGQLCYQTGNKAAAYKALRSSIRQNPPYQLAFNARVLQTEVVSKGQSRKMISRLRRMAKSPNNKDYLDQIFYAMGNIHLAEGDTAKAIASYEEGVARGTRSGLEKGALLLRLGHVYWAVKDYAGAQRCYGQAVGLISKEHADYDQVTLRSKVLDELVPHTLTVHLQDSLQTLARMSEKDRNAAIDRIIAAVKEREERERKAAADSARRAARESGANGDFAASAAMPKNPDKKNDSGEWYFYNQPVVIQGKTDFLRQWGKRVLEDNWRRSNKTVLTPAADEADTPESADSLDAVGQAGASDRAANDSVLAAEDDPHKRAFYLKQIPLTDEQKAASDELIKEALYHAGIIEKDKLEDFPLAAETLTRLMRDYPTFKPMEEVLYHLFLLESRRGRRDEAETYRRRLAAEYPDYEYTRLIVDPDYERNARYGRELEDSLYRDTYEAYRQNNLEVLRKNVDLSTEKYPTGANRPKFLFLQALSRLASGERSLLVKELRELVSKYPKSDVSEMAGMIVKGIESGRQPGTGRYDIGSLWSRRSIEGQADADSLKNGAQLTAERNTGFVVMLAYPVDSLNENQLLYDMAQFNFTGFMVRNFELQLVHEGGVGQLRITGFHNFDEAHTYVQRLFDPKTVTAELKRTRVVLISEENLALLGHGYSFDDYAKFYEQHFAPMKINPDLPLDDNAEDLIVPEENLPGETVVEPDGDDEDDTDEDDGEWYPE